MTTPTEEPSKESNTPTRNRLETEDEVEINVIRADDSSNKDDQSDE